MDRYVGRDAHAQSCTLGIVSASGQRLSLCRSAWLKKLPVPHRQLAEWLGRQLDEVEPPRDEAERWLRVEAKTHPIIRKLATAPGMVPIRSAQVVAVAATPERFRTRRQFWSHRGLGIVTRSSSAWVRDESGGWERA